MQTVTPRSSSTTPSVYDASDPITPSFNTLHISDSPGETLLAVDMETSLYGCCAPYFEMEENFSLGYREILYRIDVNQSTTYTLPQVLYKILPENSINELIVAHHRQVEAVIELRGLRQPNQDDLLAKQRLVLDRMLERAQTEVKILGPLSAIHWSSASTEPRSSSVEDSNKSEGYSPCFENMFERYLEDRNF